MVRFAGEGLDEVTGETLGSRPNYLSRYIVGLEHRLYRFSKLTNICSCPQNSANSFFYGAQKQHFSPHDMMATQLRYIYRGEIPRYVDEHDNNGGEQAGGVLQVAGEAQHAASPWLGQVQAEGEEGEQIRASDLNNSVVSVISLLYVVSSNNMLADNNKCDERTGI